MISSYWNDIMLTIFNIALENEMGIKFIAI